METSTTVAMSQEIADLRPLQIKAIGLLVGGASGRLTAETIGVSAETVSRWRQTPVFRRALDAGVQELLGEARTQLVSGFKEALDVLRESLGSEEEKYRLKAAATLTSIATKVPAAEADPAIQMSDAELRAEVERIERDIVGRNQTALDVVVDRGDAKEGAEIRVSGRSQVVARVEIEDRTALDVATQKPGENGRGGERVGDA